MYIMLTSDYAWVYMKTMLIAPWFAYHIAPTDIIRSERSVFEYKAELQMRNSIVSEAHKIVLYIMADVDLEERLSKKQL